MLRELKNAEIAGKNTASGIRQMQKIPEKNRNDGEETRRAPVQNRQKKRSRNPKIPELLRNSSPEKADRRKIHSEKYEFSLRKVLRKVEKLWIRRKKFPTLHGKKLENNSKGEEKIPENGKRKPKIVGISLEKIQEKHKKYGNEMKKTAGSTHKTRKIPDEKSRLREKTQQKPAQNRQKKCSEN